MRNILIDSGPLVALFARDDRHHPRIRALVREFSQQGVRFLTTWPCIVEASYLLQPPHRYELLQWVERQGIVVHSFESYHLGEMTRWMRRYTEEGKREMDLADASLIWLADETDITEIMTVDVVDFTRYRLPDGRAFDLL
ncbi:MAG: hypothetical protein HQL76_11280 [Magnetococcales bacterium]|nr:hypothetical protein [Magnetococcales bacterium]